MKIKEILLKIVPYKFLIPIRNLLYPEKINVLEERMARFFSTYYEDVKAPDLDQKTRFRNAEFKIYSKHGGDGILLYIFSKIGMTNHTLVEMGIEDGRECNTTNLLLNFGWKGLLIDANEKWVLSAKDFFKNKLGTQSEKVNVVHSFVTAENINESITKVGIKGEIDLLSIDIDGNDYWVWKAIKDIDPRVVVVEYNSTFGLRSITKPYKKNVAYKDVVERNPLYFGASLRALAKLGKEKGYILVACDTHGHDSYFIREDVAEGVFFEQKPEEVFYENLFLLKKIGSIEKQFEEIKNLDFVEV